MFAFVNIQALMPMQKDILIVDDHSVTRTGVKALLQDLYQDFRIVEAYDGESTLQVLKKHKIDIAFMDLQLPNTDTISLIEWMSIRYPHTYTLAFSMLPENIYGRRVIKAGASGYLPKDAPIEEIKRATEFALSNTKYLTPALLGMLKKKTDLAEDNNPFNSLSHREFEIVNMLLEGSTPNVIAQNLNIKPSTVGTYKTRIFRKLNITSVMHLREISFLYGLCNQIR